MLQALWVAAVIALVGIAHAQEPEADPPGRVARLSELNGQVWLYNPDSNEWIAAARNRPLTTGDRLATDAGARAELQIGSTTVRVDSSSELEVVQLDDERVGLQLHNGSAIAQIRDLNGAGQFDLATDEGRFLAQRAGTYRFDRFGGRSDVTVYNGQARYEGPNSGLAVEPGQRAEFWIDSGGVAQYSTTAPVSDAFAAWSNERDRRVAGSIAERYVSPEMTGAAELDAYGRWEQNPDYGSVWIPTAVSADWAPYSQGHWAWVRPWGWTWVDDAPWGFAPFHYGRWVYARNAWCWTPGTRVARPVYAPALVAWVGGPRANVSVTVGGGPAVGWFPLAPREVYVPSYRVSPRYARNVNITNVTNVTVINNVFANPQGPRDFGNRHFPRAITVVPSNVMAERRPVGPAAAQYRQAPWVRDFANQRGSAPALWAPPVAAPSLPVRNLDPRGVRPPPGMRPDAGAGDRPGFAGRPNGGPAGPRDRNEFGQRDDRGDRDRGDRRFTPSPAQPAPAVTPLAATGAPPGSIGRPGFGGEPGFRRPDGTPGTPGRTPRERELNEQLARPPGALPQPETPTMRALPVQRGEDRQNDRQNDRLNDRRLEQRRFEERRPAARPEAPMQPSPIEPPRQVQPPRFERPQMPAAPRPPEPMPTMRAPEVRRVAPPVAAPPQPRVEAPQPERQQARPEIRSNEQRRNEQR